MQRRKVLAAITAAIATPAAAWRNDPVVEASNGLTGTAWFDAVRHAGLTNLQKEVRVFMASEIETYLEDLTQQPGHGAVVDIWILREALVNYYGGAYAGKFCGLLNAIEDTLGRDRRFVAVPEEIHTRLERMIENAKDDTVTLFAVPNEISKDVAAFIVQRKAALAAAEA